MNEDTASVLETTSPLQNLPIFSKAYWHLASKNFSDLKMIVFAALILALRVGVKPLGIQLAPGLKLSFDCYVNSLGSICYGPLVGLAVGAISDTLGCLLFPSGPYFFPFIFVEMASSFIFALFLWKRTLTPLRVLFSKFTVNLICNIIMTSLLMKWDYYFFYGLKEARAYSLINLVRIGKNLVLFPLEAVLITIIIGALTPALRSLRLLPRTQEKITFRAADIITVAILLVVSVGLILFYIFFLKDFLSAHNITLG